MFHVTTSHSFNPHTLENFCIIIIIIYSCLHFTRCKTNRKSAKISTETTADALTPQLKQWLVKKRSNYTIHYLQTSMLLPNKTLSIECCSGTSINSVLCVIVISPTSLLHCRCLVYNHVLCYLIYFIQCCMCVCHVY